MQDLRADIGVDYIPGHRPDEIFINCPFCESRGHPPDTRYKMGVNLSSHRYNCFICGAKPSETGRLKDIDQLEFFVPQKDTSLEHLRNRLSRLSTRGETASGAIDIDKIAWPLTSRGTPIAYNYIKSRGFSDEEIDRYKLYVGKDYWDEEKGYTVKKWSGRVIFPLVDEKGVQYCVGRSYNGKDPKYLNSEGKKEFLVWGMDFIRDGVAILNEGIISSIAASRVTGVPAICVLGKTVSEWQASLIRTKCHTVYKSFDGGLTQLEHRKAEKVLLSVGLKVYNILLPTELKCLSCGHTKMLQYALKNCPKCGKENPDIGGPDPDELGQKYMWYFNKATRVKMV